MVVDLRRLASTRPIRVCRLTSARSALLPLLQALTVSQLRAVPTVAPFTVIARLMSGDLPAEEWRRHAETLGIATLDLSQS